MPRPITDEDVKRAEEDRIADGGKTIPCINMDSDTVTRLRNAFRDGPGSFIASWRLVIDEVNKILAEKYGK